MNVGCRECGPPLARQRATLPIQDAHCSATSARRAAAKLRHHPMFEACSRRTVEGRVALMNMAPRAIHHLNCGTMCPRGERLITGEGGLLDSAHLVCHCLLVEGAEGLVLIDTGLGLGDARNPAQLGRLFTTLFRPRALAAETAVSQIRELGFQPGDVRHIVATHLDLDHAGGLPDFPDAEVHLLGDELDAAMNPSWRERTRYVAEHWAHGPHWVRHKVEGDQWLGFDSVRILPGSDAEILLVP